ncbi:aryl hydrocarbon receptor-like [Alosa sapidissima]|uniref:aryl hydrocarbon receptor-like n=1 Tax=Alosa sapidissima TaxID=34773 RepID=UPI001C08DF98|nr:aryl hydrocarbon receptor-like [Alosa sapidissima]
MYAGRKRRKPVQRAAKPPPTEAVKSNPSKRHRDRLNSELERLASLLPFPEDVTSSLDKLSILRLSVSYLRAKNFFSVALKNHTCSNGVMAKAGSHDNGKAARLAGGWMLEGELLLQALNGFVLVITANGTIFYTSHTIQDYLGFHQTDVMHQSVFEMVHTEDQQELRQNLHWALNPPPAIYPTPQHSPTDGQRGGNSLVAPPCNPEQLPPENSSFLERSFVCRFRCLLDNSSGFLALSLQGRLKFLHGQSQQGPNGVKAPPEPALFAIATPLQSPSILEIRTKNMIFRTKHKLDFTPMACDAKGKIVLGYTEAELRVRGSGYQFIHAADMLYCAENHVRMMKTGESGLTVFRLLTKDNRWKWVQANARLVYKNGRPDYIIATQRPLLEEEGAEHLRKRSMHLPFTFATGEALLYHSSHPTRARQQGGGEGSARANKEPKDTLDPGSLLGAMMSQDESVYISQPATETKVSSLPSHLFGELKAQQQRFAESVTAAECSEVFEHWEQAMNGAGLSAAHGLPENGKSFDPLLATLDSLSLGAGSGEGLGEGGKEHCSNGELFSALEGLGLSAEDLELLLLDERMIRVEVDSERVPTLDDLLTSDEILSYIHDSLEHRGDAEGPVLAPTLQQLPTPQMDTTQVPDPCVTHASGVNSQYLTQRPPVGQPPILTLSQQMQQHLSLKQPPTSTFDLWGQQVAHPGVVNSNGLERALERHPVSNGYCSAKHTLVTMTKMTTQPELPQTFLLNHKTSQQLEGGGSQPVHYQQFPLPQHTQHNQFPQLPQCHSSHKDSTVSGPQPPFKTDPFATKDHWTGFTQSSQGETLNPGPCLYNGHVPSTCTMDSCVHYCMVDVPVTANGGTGRGNGIHQSAMNSISSYQVNPKGQEQLAQVLSSLSNQILGSGQPCRQLSSLDSCGLFTSDLSQIPAQHKLQNGCLPSATHPGDGALPSGNGLTVPNGMTPHPESVPSFTDAQTSGFFL